jgi:hypothetical protein
MGTYTLVPSPQVLIAVLVELRNEWIVRAATRSDTGEKRKYLETSAAPAKLR